MITAQNEIAIQGSRDYGTDVTPAEFDPVCDAYRALPNGARYFKSKSLASSDFIEVETTRLRRPTRNPYPLELFKNITNQPTFASAVTCDRMIRLFNTSMSAGDFAPVPVMGRVQANTFPFKGTKKVWTHVYGVQVATPFIEDNYLDCQTMQGYAGTGGPGDSFIEGSGDSYSNAGDDIGL